MLIFPVWLAPVQVKILPISEKFSEYSNGIFIITGCSHSGICNIIEHVKIVYKEKHVIDVLGVFHLFEIDERLNKTIDYFRKSNITNLCPCHCVSFDVKAEINKYKGKRSWCWFGKFTIRAKIK